MNGAPPVPGPPPEGCPGPGPRLSEPSWGAMARALASRVGAWEAEPPREGPAGGRSVVLVGAMGSGKTTVGRTLAALTGLPFVDADELFVQAHGPIPAFFATRGEPAFREAEARVIAHVLDLPRPCVLACGGGAVMTAATRRRLAGPGSVVVWLQVAEAEALTRLGGGEGRPVLAGDPAGTWRRILAERAPLYAQVADMTVDGTGRTATETASRIVEAIDDPRRSETLA